MNDERHENIADCHGAVSGSFRLRTAHTESNFRRLGQIDMYNGSAALYPVFQCV